MNRATRNNDLMNIFACKIGKSENIENSDYICKSNLTRIVAIETSITIKSSFCKDTEGLILPQDSVEYFQTEEGEILTITGKANLTAVF